MPPPIRVLIDKRDWPHRVTVQRVSYTSDDGGGNLTTTATLRRNVPCFVNLGAKGESKSNDRQQAEASHTVVFYTDPLVRNGDRFVYGSRLFVVQGAKNNFDFDLIWEVTCTEIVA